MVDSSSMLGVIREWLEATQKSLDDENISWGQVAQIESVYETIEVFMEEE